jgi:outer membrane protein
MLEYSYKTLGMLIFIGLWAFSLPVYKEAHANRVPLLQQEGPASSEVIEMSLADAVFLSLRHNRDIRTAYLERVIEKFELKVAEDKFFPDIDVTGNTKRLDSKNDIITTIYDEDVSVSFSEKIPTGGEFIFKWSVAGQQQENEEDTQTNSWELTFSQPLLRGGGIETNTASVTIARLNEQRNILGLKYTVINNITNTIKAYRSFLQAKRQVEINEKSLDRAKKLLKINQFLIDTGRMARMEMIQAEADVAAKEFSYETGKNNMETARLNLLKILDIDKHTLIIPVEEDEVTEVAPDYDKCLKLALKNRTDFRENLIDLQLAQVDLDLAKNDKLWDLSFIASYQKSKTYGGDVDNETYDWSAGLGLSIPLYGDLTKKQGVLTARTRLRQAQIRRAELKDNLEIEVKDAIHNIKIKFNQLKLAHRARELSEIKLRVEQEKLKVGRSSNFQIVTFQNDLVFAQNSELDAMIAYRNALTDLDQTLETTLDTWKVDLDRYKVK